MWCILFLTPSPARAAFPTKLTISHGLCSSRMRSDGFDEDSQQNTWRTRNMPVMAMTIEDDLRHARYWNKKLYECEANMPDRYGPIHGRFAITKKKTVGLCSSGVSA